MQDLDRDLLKLPSRVKIVENIGYYHRYLNFIRANDSEYGGGFVSVRQYFDKYDASRLTHRSAHRRGLDEMTQRRRCGSQSFLDELRRQIEL